MIKHALDDFSQNFAMDNHGNLLPIINILNSGYSAYYCRWD